MEILRSLRLNDQIAQARRGGAPLNLSFFWIFSTQSCMYGDMDLFMQITMKTRNGRASRRYMVFTSWAPSNVQQNATRLHFRSPPKSMASCLATRCHVAINAPTIPMQTRTNCFMHKRDGNGRTGRGRGSKVDADGGQEWASLDSGS